MVYECMNLTLMREGWQLCLLFKIPQPLNYELLHFFISILSIFLIVSQYFLNLFECFCFDTAVFQFLSVSVYSEIFLSMFRDGPGGVLEGPRNTSGVYRWVVKYFLRFLMGLKKKLFFFIFPDFNLFYNLIRKKKLIVHCKISHRSAYNLFILEWKPTKI